MKVNAGPQVPFSKWVIAVRKISLLATSFL